MSMIKRLLRNLHIGGSVNEHNNQSRFGDNRPTNNSNPNPNPLNTSATTSTSSSRSPYLSLPSSFDSTKARLVESAVNNSVDFNFFEEEFQVQLALAISASDPDGREDPNPYRSGLLSGREDGSKEMA